MEPNSLTGGLGSLHLLSDSVSRSISAENPSGEKGAGGKATVGTGAEAARDLGVGWKISPSVEIGPTTTCELADIAGSGAIQSIWLTGKVINRDFVLRIYWDGQETPSVECPLPDFFALPWVDPPSTGRLAPLLRINSLPVCVNPNRGMNSYWYMPFRSRCRITLENRSPFEVKSCYYQINYELCSVPKNAVYFHAQFRQVNPVARKQVYIIVDGIEGAGQYVGTSMGWGINAGGWWGEGEIKFYMDGDKDFPTICGTGVEDYFGGAYGWIFGDHYAEYSTPFLGMHVFKPDGLVSMNYRHSMYRWHILDPIRFKKDLRVTIQALGWRSKSTDDDPPRYVPGTHNVSSVAYWYQSLPTAVFPELPDRDEIATV